MTMSAPLPGGAWESGRAEPHRGRPDRALAPAKVLQGIGCAGVPPPTGGGGH
jgi:hypothetical protein